MVNFHVLKHGITVWNVQNDIDTLKKWLLCYWYSTGTNCDSTVIATDGNTIVLWCIPWYQMIREYRSFATADVQKTIVLHSHQSFGQRQFPDGIVPTGTYTHTRLSSNFNAAKPNFALVANSSYTDSQLCHYNLKQHYISGLINIEVVKIN